MPDAPGTMTTDRILQTVNYANSRGGGAMRPSMGAIYGGGASGGGASAGGVRRTPMGGSPGGGAMGYQPGGSMGYANPFGGANGPVTGQQYRRTDRTPLPQQAFLEESYGVDPYGREFVQSSQINPGYVDPNLRFQLEHESSRREGEARDRLAEIRETGNQGRLTQGQQQSWTTGERVRGRGEELEDDRRIFERLPGLWSMFTGEGGSTPGAAGDRPSMAALSSAGGAQGLTAGGTPGQSGQYGGINPGGGVQTGGVDRLPVEKGSTPGIQAAGDTGGASAADLAFARAKDKAGLLANARLRGARSQLANSSLGTQARGVDTILGDAEQGLTNVATAQAIAEAQRAADVEDRNYAGAITRRGQNMGLAPSILALMRGNGGPRY